jgi:hypothetical protein
VGRTAIVERGPVGNLGLVHEVLRSASPRRASRRWLERASRAYRIALALSSPP